MPIPTASCPKVIFCSKCWVCSKLSGSPNEGVYDRQTCVCPVHHAALHQWMQGQILSPGTSAGHQWYLSLQKHTLETILISPETHKKYFFGGFFVHIVVDFLQQHIIFFTKKNLF